MKKFTLMTLFLAGILLCCNVLAFTPTELQSPTGYWLTIDDKTHQPRGVVQLYLVKTKKGEQLRGKAITGLYIPGAIWRKNCTDCVAPWTDKPIGGMTFMWNFQKDGSEWDSTWTHGQIFDIDSSKDIYRCKLWLANQGKNLKVRGYVFIFFRTQTWHRITKAQVDKYMAQAQKQLKTHPYN